jgi:UDP-N-acetylmuramoyl-L-alanine---L-glutamate ligase
MTRQLKDKLRDKKILILGLGKEGESSYRFFRQLFPNKVLLVADKKPIDKLDKRLINVFKGDSHLKLFLGKDYLQPIKESNVVIKTPGIPKDIPKLRLASRRGVIVTSQTGLFFTYCRGKIIGVTGTKGKSTATSVIFKVLQEGGKRSFLVGNIGEPVLPYLEKDSPNTYFAFELSCHQLNDIRVSPHIAVILNLYPEHLDYYPNFNFYKRAKSHITRYQTQADYLLYRSSDRHVLDIARKTKAKKIPFTLEGNHPKRGGFLKDGNIVLNLDGVEEKIISEHDIPLIGRFNLHNVMPAIIVGRLIGIPIAKIKQAIKKFKPLDFRLELVGTFGGIKFYNDPLATIPQATIAAIETLGSNNVETLMLGGLDRGIDYTDFAKWLTRGAVKSLILFPDSGKRLHQTIKIVSGVNKLAISSFFVENMKDAVQIAYKKTSVGKICLHSPAAPACGVGFKDYRERGGLFKKYVTELGQL